MTKNAKGIESYCAILFKLFKRLSILVWAVMLLAAGAIGMFIFLNFSVFIISNNFIQDLTGAEVILVAPSEKIALTTDEEEALLLLVEKGHVLTQDQFLEVVSEFYNSIINTLIVVISLLGVFAYFSISSLSRRHAEELVEDYVERGIEGKFSNDEYVEKLFNKSGYVNELIDSEEKRANTINKMNEKYKFFEERLNAIEYWLMSSSVPSEEGEIHVEEADEDGNN